MIQIGVRDTMHEVVYIRHARNVIIPVLLPGASGARSKRLKVVVVLISVSESLYELRALDVT